MWARGCSPKYCLCPCRIDLLSWRTTACVSNNSGDKKSKLTKNTSWQTDANILKQVLWDTSRRLNKINNPGLGQRMGKNVQQPRLAQVRSSFSKHLTALTLKPVHLVKYLLALWSLELAAAAGHRGRHPKALNWETPTWSWVWHRSSSRQGSHSDVTVLN